MMRNQIREHPESLPQLLQEIGQANPQLLTVISFIKQYLVTLLLVLAQSTARSKHTITNTIVLIVMVICSLRFFKERTFP